MDIPGAAARPSGVEVTGSVLRTRATGRNHLNVLPDSLLELLLSRVSARTGGYSHALVCRRWAALASSAQALVRLCPPWNPLEESQRWDECRGNLQPDRGTLAWPHLKLHVSTEELIRALQSLPQVTALDLPGISMYDVSREQFLRLLRACPRLRALRAPGLSLRADPQNPREEWCYWKLLRRNNASLPSAALLDCAPNLRLLDLRRCRLVVGSDEHAAAAVELEVLVPGAGGHGAGDAFALQQLQVLKASVQLPDHAEPLRLRSMPRLKALSLKLLREEDAEEHASPLLIGSPSLKELHLELPARLLLQLGPLPALRALSLTLSSSSRLAIPGLSRLTALTSLALSGGCVPVTEAGDDALAWLRALTKLRSLMWVSWAAPLPVSALGLLTGLTRLEVFARSLECTDGLAGWQQLRSLRSFSISMEPWRCISTQLIEGVAELRTLKDLTVCIDGEEDGSVDLNAVSSLG